MNWPLMQNAIGDEEKGALLTFIKESDFFTQGKNVKEFEKEWSQWLGVKYSLFVNAGSSANLLLLDAIKEIYFPDKRPKIMVPSCTWSTTIAPLLQQNYDIIFCDIDLDTYGFDLDSLSIYNPSLLNTKNVDIIFFTHILGMPSNINKVKEIFPDAMILEDCCEAHGAFIEEKKVGTFGLGSTFSFYFGHHMTSIEGGMVCTDNKEVYNLLLAKRSHGLARETLTFEEYKTQYPLVDPKFLFITTGYNMRNTEMNAVIGRHQLKKLDYFIERRRCNYIAFRRVLENWKEHFIIPPWDGNSSFALPFVCKDNIKEELESFLNEQGIETRPFLVGNIVRQPFIPDENYKDYKNAEILHHNGFYIGNSQFVSHKELEWLEDILDEFFNMHDSKR